MYVSLSTDRPNKKYTLHSVSVRHAIRDGGHSASDATHDARRTRPWTNNSITVRRGGLTPDARASLSQAHRSGSSDLLPWRPSTHAHGQSGM